MLQQPLTPERLRHFLQTARACGLSPRAREHLRWLEHFAENGCSVSVTCRHFGIQRMTFYRVLRRCDFINPLSLEDGRRASFVQSTASEIVAGAAAQPASHSSCANPGHQCLLCGLKAVNWRPVKRGLVLGSVAANFVLMLMLGAMLFLESDKAPTAVKASILGPEKQVIYSLVPLP